MYPEHWYVHAALSKPLFSLGETFMEFQKASTQ